MDSLEKQLWEIYDKYDVKCVTTIILDYNNAEYFTNIKYPHKSEEFRREYTLDKIKQRYKLREKK